ncbi:MAG: bifunctional 5,10-methylenetetrahydrofolate dehydrogenase/5,10-methenyltetrahydrofolate cyclohydrolase [Candidatus Moranbacteria bacterium]|jgi:methylenetetrahydrofolate dehydrogenase (NADP+)/methenyltetrahydrofolate cyclohydrolase|nr:bifunctional 5,10-methylenetetrahydrofolate dehydrogenase/5,10-methenyltetrahydrofolate cyclohydrolase [Candidatus Moranbacteria bacterium]MDX9855342.1 bifunctional 5,10-methylenetetrahydrofolate dehydrogenase/5,10-methenyltetrahydrofolate cyclohydrolase [Candidatus Moranbacteria bacterium]
MKLIDGKKIADGILAELKEKIKNSGFVPGLAVVLVGNDKASQIYVGLKEKAAREVGINFEKFLFDEDVKEEEIISKIEGLNKNENIHGIIVQLPLPEKFDTDKIINAIYPEKDADGFRNGSKNENPVFPSAIMKMIRSESGDIKSAVIITKSSKFGESMQGVLEKNNVESDYLFCDKFEKDDLSGYDAVITACGMPDLIGSESVRDGAVVIDGGIKKEGKKVLGDIDIESFKNTDCAVSPVPGGVGPVTVACLLESVYELALKK